MNSKSLVPKIIFQTSVARQPEYIVKSICSKCPGYKYLHFNDEDILIYFKENPLDDFPFIEEKYNKLTEGAHKADLFRYYYLYINGGVYLDSDAILEKNIDEILKNHEFVSVVSYHNENSKMIFNGFIGTVKKHPIIYDALKDIYNIGSEKLKSDYHLVCKNLYSIVKKYSCKNIKLYQEKKVKSFKAGVISVDENNEIILKHYCYSKKIPDYSSKFSSFFYYFVYRFRLLYNLYKLF
jgi:hypothetical protein